MKNKPLNNPAIPKSMQNVDKIERRLKVIELINLIVNPILIFALGFILTGKIEGVKSEVARQHYWNNKLADTFYEQFQTYTKSVSDFASKAAMLLEKVKKGEQNDTSGLKMQMYLNESSQSIFINSNALKAYSISLEGKENKITNQIDKIYNIVSQIMNEKQGNPNDIYIELTKLNTEAKNYFINRLKL